MSTNLRYAWVSHQTESIMVLGFVKSTEAIDPFMARHLCSYAFAIDFPRDGICDIHAFMCVCMGSATEAGYSTRLIHVQGAMECLLSLFKTECDKHPKRQWRHIAENRLCRGMRDCGNRTTTEIEACPAHNGNETSYLPWRSKYDYRISFVFPERSSKTFTHRHRMKVEFRAVCQGISQAPSDLNKVCVLRKHDFMHNFL